MQRFFNFRHLISGLFVLGGSWSCVTGSDEPDLPELTVDQIGGLIPARVKDRSGWAEDIVTALELADVRATLEHACAVIAVIEQESGYQVDPAVPNLPQIVRQGMLDKLTRLGPLAEPALKAILSGSTPGETVTFSQRIDKLRTERDLDRLFRDINTAYRGERPGPYIIASAISKLLGKGDFRDWNPVTTAGSMQVKISFAEELEFFQDLPDSALREKLYTRTGGVVAGTARLLSYDTSYDDVVYRFADFNAGVYASRNAEFQAMLSLLTAMPLELDGDLLAYDKNGDPLKIETKTLAAMLAFGQKNGLSQRSVQRAAAKEKTVKFEKTAIWDVVRDQWRLKTGKEPAYARIPQVQLASPKLSGSKTTAWFAASVKRRYQRCRKTMDRVFPEGI